MNQTFFLLMGCSSSAGAGGRGFCLSGHHFVGAGTTREPAAPRRWETLREGYQQGPPARADRP
jgi:hypothetical protein